jgi:hypothetical protein
MVCRVSRSAGKTARSELKQPRLKPESLLTLIAEPGTYELWGQLQETGTDLIMMK